jgi:hypothetical protein
MAKCYKITMYVSDLNGSPRFEEELKSIRGPPWNGARNVRAAVGRCCAGPRG